VLSFPVPGASSEKFVLAIVLLNVFLHGQGHRSGRSETSITLSLRRALPRTGRIADGMKLTATIIRSVEAGIQAELRHIECAVAAGTRDAGRGQGPSCAGR
jgi:hypothetical protein